MSQKPMQSIYDLADTLGVSASTVSRVLNQRRGIGAATRKRVLASARAAGFRPSMSARQLTIAVVIDCHRFSSFGGFVSNLLSCIVEALSKRDVAVELVTEHNLDRIHGRLVDGILAMTWDDKTVDLLRRAGAPVVTLNGMDVEGFSAAATDHRQHGRAAVEYLAARGHRRISMVCEERNNWGTRQRIDGFLAQLQAMELPVDEYSVCFTDHQPINGLLHRLMTEARPTAIFVANESLGLEATHVLQYALHYKVPQDVSLLGMESVRVSQFLSPPLTTLAQPLNELAEKSLELLLSQVASGAEPQCIVLESRLIERESVASIGVD